MVSAFPTLACAFTLCVGVTTGAADSTRVPDIVDAVADSAAVPEAAKSNQSIATTESGHGHGNTIGLNGALGYGSCHSFSNYSWSNAKYVCVWGHDTGFGWYYNVFVKRYDGGFNHECWCRDGLSMYDPWSSRWTYSVNSVAACYTRDGRSADSVG